MHVFQSNGSDSRSAGTMSTPILAQLAVSARIENLADLADLREGRIASSEVRRVEVSDAILIVEILDGRMVSGGIGLSMPRQLVERLGLVPIGVHRSPELRPASRYAARLIVQGRDCAIDVRAVEDGRPVLIGFLALRAMGLRFEVEGNRLVEDEETDIGPILELD